MTLLAEGIETRGQLGGHRSPGREFAQGFLFSAALPASEVPVMIGYPLGSDGFDAISASISS
jgi:sensor c-di-GMP phosphodiesterase-like protein